jgi:hypothetical protein
MATLLEQLLSDPEALLLEKPFYRSMTDTNRRPITAAPTQVDITGTLRASLPKIYKNTVTQEQFASELDVYSHGVLFDDNIPSITIKTAKNGYLEIKQYRIAIPFQVLIRDKQVRHLCVNPMQMTLLITNPTDKQDKQFTRIKQAWDEKNMEGAKTQFVQDQKSYGNAALLFYLDNGKVYTRNISFNDGYKIISHKDNNGRHILECLYYCIDDVEYIDAYDEKYMTRFTNETSVNAKGEVTSSWLRYPAVEHGFSEIPLITKRGDVAWNRGQPIIESYEALWNTFIAIQKRHGWGMIYIKGQFQEGAKRIAGNVVLNDTSLDPNADAKVLTPPDPNNMIDTLKAMEQAIQKATGTTFILPEDIKISGDASGLAIEMTQELDMATAQDGVIEWQNVANKMMRLFKEGLAKELVTSGEAEYASAITDFEQLRINTKFMVWKPKSEESHNAMLATMKGAGMISQQTSVEKNTISTPDEMARIKKEVQEADEREAAKTAATSTENQGEQSTSTSINVVTD